MLMHEFKIPSRVEAYAGRCKEGQQPDVSKAEWKFLGYVSFAPKPGGTARELKVIQVNAVGSFFRCARRPAETLCGARVMASYRLRFTGFVDHPRNLTNQVALISLAVMGSIHVPRHTHQNHTQFVRSFRPLRASRALAGSSASRGRQSLLLPVAAAPSTWRCCRWALTCFR